MEMKYNPARDTTPELILILSAPPSSLAYPIFRSLSDMEMQWLPQWIFNVVNKYRVERISLPLTWTNSVFPIKLINKSSGKVDEKNPFYFHFSETLIEKKDRRWGERKQATARCNCQSNTNKRVTESKERGEEKK